MHALRLFKEEEGQAMDIGAHPVRDRPFLLQLGTSHACCLIHAAAVVFAQVYEAQLGSTAFLLG